MKKILIILVLVFALIKGLTLFPETTYDRDLISNPIQEEYNQNLSVTLQSVAQIEAFMGDMTVDSNGYVIALDSLLRQRFYHRCSYYTIKTNALAYLMGTLFWEHFKAVVIPDEILKFPCAQCSQIAIVFQSVLLKKGYHVRTVKLRNHFCTEVFYDGSWHFFDPDFEPKINEVRNIPSVAELLSNDTLLQKLYNLSPGHKVHLYGVKFHFDKEYLEINEPNKIAAQNMRILHWILNFAVNYGWLIFGCMYILVQLKARRKK
mgnify:CR=1 FL=1